MSETKVCRSCEKRKPVSEFYVKRVLVSGKTLYRPDCKDCNKAAIAGDHAERERIRVATAAWRAADPERARLGVREYHTRNKAELSTKKHIKRYDPSTRAIILEQGRAAYVRNRDIHLRLSKEWALANPEAHKAYHRLYWKNNPDKAAEYRARRRALIRNAPGTHTSDDIADIRRMQRDRCAVPSCRVKLNGKGHKDHRQALSKGGSNDRRNIQILCGPCNSTKHTTDEIDFMQSLGFLM